MKKNILNLAIGFQTVAQAISISIIGSGLGTYLFLVLDFNELLVNIFEKLIATSLVFLVALQILKKYPKGLIFIGLYFFIEALMVWVNGGKAHSNLAAFTHMARYLTPFALYFLLQGREKLGITLLKWAIGITFIFHGIKALDFNPLFIDYLMEGVEGLFNLSLTESTANQLLILIGVTDIILGLLALFKCPPWIYYYMAFWGGITALFRFYFHAELGILPMFIRINHLIIPLYIGLNINKVKLNFQGEEKCLSSPP